MQPNGEFFLSDGSYAVAHAYAIIGFVLFTAFIWLPLLLYVVSGFVWLIKRAITWISTKR